LGLIKVNVDNFARAESNRMFASFQAEAGGVNVFRRTCEPTRVDHQPVIRMNRDTLYSAAVVDISEGATVAIPDCSTEPEATPRSTATSSGVG